MHQPNPQPTSESNSKDSQQAGAVSSSELATVQSFVPRPPRFKLADVVLPAETRRQIATLLSRVRNHSLLYDEWELAKIDPLGQHKVANFYGPPGTGKTMVAEALASELRVNVIEVNYAEIESKYVGETPKNIRAAFGRAADTQSMLFFDEADSILGRRMTNVTQAADHAVNVARAVMLKELDAFTGVVVFATNLAKNFDGAFVRRIMLHIHVPPPDLQGRRELWLRMLSPRVPGWDAIDWHELAAKSAGLVGGDIKNAVVMTLSDLANRTGSERVIRQDDLHSAVESVLRSKREVGSVEGLEVRELDISEVPRKLLEGRD